MTPLESIDTAGTPKVHHVFAVFDDGDSYRGAEQALIAMDLEPEQLLRSDASALEQPAGDAGVLGRMGRFLKAIGGERHVAQIYAHHLREGRVVAAAPVSSHELAREVARLLTRQGGYEVTYFGNWSVRYLSPQENLDHGVPSHRETNADE
jgi:hypothetical protein